LSECDRRRVGARPRRLRLRFISLRSAHRLEKINSTLPHPRGELSAFNGLRQILFPWQRACKKAARDSRADA